MSYFTIESLIIYLVCIALGALLYHVLLSKEATLPKIKKNGKGLANKVIDQRGFFLGCISNGVGVKIALTPIQAANLRKIIDNLSEHQRANRLKVINLDIMLEGAEIINSLTEDYFYTANNPRIKQSHKYLAKVRCMNV